MVSKSSLMFMANFDSPTKVLREHFTGRQRRRAARIWRKRRLDEFHSSISEDAGAGAIRGLMAGLAWVFTSGILLTLTPIWTLGFGSGQSDPLWLTLTVNVVLIALPIALVVGTLLGWRLAVVSAREVVLGHYSLAGSVRRNWMVRGVLSIPAIVFLIVFLILGEILLAVFDINMSWPKILFDFATESVVGSLIFYGVMAVFFVCAVLLVAWILAVPTGMIAQANWALSGAGLRDHRDSRWRWGWAIVSNLALTALTIAAAFSAYWLFVESVASGMLWDEFMGRSSIKGYYFTAAAIYGLVAIMMLVAFVAVVVNIGGLERGILPFDDFLGVERARSWAGRAAALAVLAGTVLWYETMYGVRDTVPIWARSETVANLACGASREFEVRFGRASPDSHYMRLNLPPQIGANANRVSLVELSLETDPGAVDFWAIGQEILGQPLVIIPRGTGSVAWLTAHRAGFGDEERAFNLRALRRCIDVRDDTPLVLTTGEPMLTVMTLDPDLNNTTEGRWVWTGAIKVSVDLKYPDEKIQELEIRPISRQPFPANSTQNEPTARVSFRFVEQTGGLGGLEDGMSIRFVDGAVAFDPHDYMDRTSFALRKVGPWQLNVTITAGPRRLSTRDPLQNKPQKPMVFIAYIGVR